MIDTWSFANTAAGRVLRAIQLRGKARVDEVAADLGVSASAVRQHVGQLQASGALRTDKVRDGVGRPYHVYSVTPEGYQLFQNDYGDLARFLLDEVSEVEEPQVLGEILSRTAVRMAQTHRAEIHGSTLAERVEAFAHWLERRGVPVRIERDDEGYALRAYGCPYHSVAMENHAVCEIERQVMARLLLADVQRVQCVFDEGLSTGSESQDDALSSGGCKFTINVRRSQEKYDG
jgi:DeoR family suf operon transcriptional repressor